MYVPLRYLALSAVLLGLMASGVPVHAATHKGSTSTAKGVIYSCSTRHTVDVFGDEDSAHGFSASVDHQTSLPLMGEFQTPTDTAHPYPVNMLIFGKKGEPERIILAQGIQRTFETGDHGVTISVVGSDGNEQWHDSHCYGAAE